MTVKLEKWCMCALPWQAPEVRETYLEGDVFGHPKHKDGKRIITSSIIKSEGRFVTSKTGTVYELGFLKPDYKEFLEKNNYPFDEENPIKLVDKISL